MLEKQTHRMHRILLTWNDDKQKHTTKKRREERGYIPINRKIFFFYLRCASEEEFTWKKIYAWSSYFYLMCVRFFFFIFNLFGHMIVSFQVFYWTCNRTKDCSMISRPHCYVDILTFNYICTTWTMNSNNNNSNTTTVTRLYDFIMAMLSIESLSFYLILFILYLLLLYFYQIVNETERWCGGIWKQNSTKITFSMLFLFSRLLFDHFFSSSIVDRSVHSWNYKNKVQ